MPRWETGHLIDAPQFTWRNWIGLLGPGLVMGGAAIGGGEWLMGPKTAAQYGGGLFWLATLSIVGQVFYNIEISRYTMYCGEPIFVGKFRVPPRPLFWLVVYMILDCGSIFPYLAAGAATPVAGIWLGRMPDPVADYGLIRAFAYAIFIAFLFPLVVGGKVYNSMKVLMSIKIVVVLGFLLLIAVLYSEAATWVEIITGFFKFGNVPVPTEPTAVAVPGANLDNVFVALWEGRDLPAIDWGVLGILSAMVAIAGNGGLTNTSISAYTRDQGWGMGGEVGAVPSVIGGQKIQLSHVGKVFEITGESLARWRRWVRHLMRDQIAVWAPACFVGLALPSMLSVQFLPRGFVGDDWRVAGMTAGAVQDHVTTASGLPVWGMICWYMVLLCGLLTLAPSTTSAADGFVRRWVDVLWVGSRRMHQVDPKKIKHFYFGMLAAYIAFGLTMLTLVPNPTQLVKITGLIYNFALGASCWHTLVINSTLLPPQLRPNWLMRIGLALAGAFFFLLACMVLVVELKKAGWI
jgi:hypothetical protein